MHTGGRPETNYFIGVALLYKDTWEWTVDNESVVTRTHVSK